MATAATAKAEHCTRRVRALAVGVALLWGLGGPILGVQQMSALTMYGNVKHIGGSNHLLVPTDLLFTAFPSRLGAPVGLLRVDHTDSPTLQGLAPADSTSMLPPRARALMRGAGAATRYFGAYCARMYFMREHDLPTEGTIGNDTPGGNNEASNALSDAPPAPTSYVLSEYELRRVLALARRAGERFSVTYTRLPTHMHSPAAWRDHKGTRVTVFDDPETSSRRCRVGGGLGLWSSACDASEPGVAPPPPWWLTKVLMQYPVPLVPDSPEDPRDELHCSA